MRRSFLRFLFFSLFLLVSSVCLFAAAGTVQFTYKIFRAQRGTVSRVFFSTNDPNALADISSSTMNLDTEAAYNEPQFLVVSCGNLTKNVDTERRVFLTFPPLTSAEDPNFYGGYVVTLWRYDSNGNIMAKRDKAKVVGSESGTSKNSASIDWGLDFAYNNDTEYANAQGEDKVSYYGISIVFEGDCCVNSATTPEYYNFLDSYSSGIQYMATVIMEMQGN